MYREALYEVLFRYELFDKANQMAQEWLTQDMEDYDKLIAKNVKSKKAKQKMITQMQQDKEDLLEARDFDAQEVERSKEEQNAIKAQYDVAYAEHKELQEEFSTLDAENNDIISQM